MRLLVLDAYAPGGREAVRRAGGTEAGVLYRELLGRLAKDPLEVEIAHPADGPVDVQLSGFDGVVWTGSSLSILDADDPAVRRQIELARAVFAAGVPSFGSCWAAQLACVAAGGSCRANPKGREFGVSRQIRLSEAGRAHPVYADKPEVFDAFTSHADEIDALPPGGVLLASNAFSQVQAVSIGIEKASFWAVQYHPEYDPHEVAALCRLRLDELVAQGSFATPDEGHAFIDKLETLQRDPSCSDLARELRLGPELLDEELRTLEVRNWLERAVRPHMA